MAKHKDAATTDELGYFITSALAIMGNGPINAHLPVPLPLPGCQPEPDCDEIEGIDAADPSNIRIFTASGAVFVVRIVREG